MHGSGQGADKLSQAACAAGLHQGAADHDGIGMTGGLARLGAVADTEPGGDGQICAGSQTVYIFLGKKVAKRTQSDIMQLYYGDNLCMEQKT